jgi:hypothetical protein
MTIFICPNCGTENLAGEINCRKCHISLKHAQEHPEQFEEQKQQARQGEQTTPEEQSRSLGCTTNAMRWIGRVWGLLLIIILSPILFFWYLGSAGGAGPPGYVYLVGITIIAGMIVAWWQEGLGASVSLAGLVGFYVSLWAFDRGSFHNWVWVFVFILPPIALLLTSSLLRRYKSVPEASRQERENEQDD